MRTLEFSSEQSLAVIGNLEVEPVAPCSRS